MAAAVALFISCSKNSSAPEEPTLPTRHVLFSDGYENDLSQYTQVTYMPGWSTMSISTAAAHSGTHSLASDTNKCGIKKILDTAITDSIAGLEFYCMAKRTGQTNFYAALATSGSSPTGLWVIMGMGIDRSDSLKFIYQNSPTDIINNEERNFAALDTNRWYKCNIEYNFSDSTLTCYLDDDTVRTRNVPNPGTLPRFVTMRDSLGSQGPREYYLDDVTVYKR